MEEILLKSLSIVLIGAGHNFVTSDIMILHGAIADNVKKSFQLKLIPVKDSEYPALVKKSEYSDQIGDFTKDFLYPALVFKFLLSLSTGFFQNFLVGFKLATGGLN